ncbi:MAG TPA: helix-turn-helix domain-containing protein [Actinotalea sp.]|nr:helix-turn-helix domain-containing protein [Actinotalea sp.]
MDPSSIHMYYTCMDVPDGALVEIDRALRLLRREVDPPAAVDDHGRRIEASTLLVLEAVLDGRARTVQDVAHHLGVAHSTASRLVTRAESAAMVRRVPSPVSAREAWVTATDLGTATRARGHLLRRFASSGLTGRHDAQR